MDHIIKVTANGMRGIAAVTTDLVEEARCRHDCYPVCAAALGRTMTATLLLAANLKTAESITMRISGDGPIGEIVADAQGDTVRGYVRNPHTHLPLNGNKLPVGQAVGQGMIHVTRFTGLKHPFTGSAHLVSGEIAEDVANYLYISEQTPSSVALGVLVNTDNSVAAAGGFYIQALPGEVPETMLALVEKNLSTLAPVSSLIASGYDAEGILRLVFAGAEVIVHEKTPVKFACRCSRERVERMLVDLGQQEITEMIMEGQAEVCCHFCGEKYQFPKEELELLFQLSINSNDD